jgi:small membrane protein
MMQQYIAIAIILFFIVRLFSQRKKSSVSQFEFNLWLLFWFFSFFVILFIKQIDKAVAYLGFSAAGIDVLFYLAIVLMFYLLFRMRIKMEKIEKDITVLVRKISLSEEKPGDRKNL